MRKATAEENELYHKRYDDEGVDSWPGAFPIGTTDAMSPDMGWTLRYFDEQLQDIGYRVVEFDTQADNYAWTIEKDPAAPPTKLYQVWYETNIGPLFASREEAMEYLLAERNKYADTWPTMTMAELEKQMERDYPAIEEIILGDTTFDRDR